MTAASIDRFDGIYSFLSSFYQCNMQYNGYTYKSAEHAYQAAKAVNKLNHDSIANQPAAADAKRLGRRCSLPLDWEISKVGVMKAIVRAKFFGNFYLAARLKATNDDLLVEGNSWGDGFWGVDLYTYTGKNLLGKILMEIREELHDSEFQALESRKTQLE